MPTEVVGSIIAALCALAAGLASLSFFAGVDESVGYVFKETQIDKLTGLNARVAMVGKIAEAAAATIRTGKPVFLIDIDIDRFKHINDSIGYSQGDELIRAFGERLQASLPDKVVIGRIGAGEFAVLYPDSEACKADGPDRRGADRAIDGALPAAYASAIGQPFGRHRRHAEGRHRSGAAAAPVQSCAAACACARHRQLVGIRARHGPGRRLPAMDRGRTAHARSCAATSTCTTSRSSTWRRARSSATRR